MCLENLVICGADRLVLGRALALKIDAQFVRIFEDIASSMAVTFSKLGNELLDTGCEHGDYALFFTLFELNLLVERTFKSLLKILRHRGCLAFGPLGIAALAVCGVCDTRVRWLPRFCCSGSATTGAEAIVALWAGACGFCLGQSSAVSGMR